MRSLHLSGHRDAARAHVCLQCLFRTCHQHCPCSAECSRPPWLPQYPSKGKALSPLPADHTCAGTAHPTLWGWRSVPPRAGRMLGPGSKQHQRQLLCSFLPGLFACVGCVPRGTRRRARGRVASPVPACAVTLLLQRLQDKEVRWGHPTISPCPAPVPRPCGCQALAAHRHSDGWQRAAPREEGQSKT